MIGLKILIAKVEVNNPTDDKLKNYLKFITEEDHLIGKNATNDKLKNYNRKGLCSSLLTILQMISSKL